MLNRHVASSRPRALVVASAALLVWASIAATASAAPNKKTFSASVSPNPLIAGGSYSVAPRAPIQYTLTNTSSSAELGSANVTVPSGVAASAVSTNAGTALLVGTVIQLRNLSLSPGESATVGVSAQVECASNQAPYRWTTATKQSNDFNGTGNDLAGTSPTSTVSGSCALTFSKQPL